MKKPLYFVVGFVTIILTYRYFKINKCNEDDDRQLIGSGIKCFTVEINDWRELKLKPLIRNDTMLINLFLRLYFFWFNNTINPS